MFANLLNLKNKEKKRNYLNEYQAIL